MVKDDDVVDENPIDDVNIEMDGGVSKGDVEAQVGAVSRATDKTLNAGNTAIEKMNDVDAAADQMNANMETAGHDGGDGGVSKSIKDAPEAATGGCAEGCGPIGGWLSVFGDMFSVLSAPVAGPCWVWWFYILLVLGTFAFFIINLALLMDEWYDTTLTEVTLKYEAELSYPDIYLCLPAAVYYHAFMCCAPDCTPTNSGGTDAFSKCGSWGFLGMADSGKTGCRSMGKFNDFSRHYRATSCPYTTHVGANFPSQRNYILKNTQISSIGAYENITLKGKAYQDIPDMFADLMGGDSGGGDSGGGDRCGEAGVQDGCNQQTGDGCSGDGCNQQTGPERRSSPRAPRRKLKSGRRLLQQLPDLSTLKVGYAQFPVHDYATGLEDALPQLKVDKTMQFGGSDNGGQMDNTTVKSICYYFKVTDAAAATATHGSQSYLQSMFLATMTDALMRELPHLKMYLVPPGSPPTLRGKVLATEITWPAVAMKTIGDITVDKYKDTSKGATDWTFIYNMGLSSQPIVGQLAILAPAVDGSTATSQASTNNTFDGSTSFEMVNEFRYEYSDKLNFNLTAIEVSLKAIFKAMASGSSPDAVKLADPLSKCYLSGGINPSSESSSAPAGSGGTSTSPVNTGFFGTNMVPAFNALTISNFVVREIVVRHRTVAEYWAAIGGLFAGSLLILSLFFAASGVSHNNRQVQTFNFIGGDTKEEWLKEYEPAEVSLLEALEKRVKELEEASQI